MQEDTRTDEKATAVPTPKGSALKDFSTPIAIVVAGLAIGAGLYFQSGPAAPTATAPVAANDQPAVDNTGKVDPVQADEHIKGDPEAPIKIVEFSDFDCPFCNRFHVVMDDVLASNDDVALVYRQFPLEQLHPNAPAVAMASECVAELGGNDAFWKFADAYFNNRATGNQTSGLTLIPKYVEQAGVDKSAFDECFNSNRYQDAIQADMNDAVETGGRGTPWSIIVSPSGKTYPINGALPQQSVEQLIEVARQDG